MHSRFSPPRPRLAAAFAAAAVLGPALAPGSPPASPPLAESLVPGDSELVELAVHPPAISLRGADRAARLVVTGLYSNGGARDLTREVAYAAADPAIALVDAGGLVKPAADGSTTIRITAGADGELERTVAVTVASAATDLPINFPNDIVPIFSKHGCNAGGCHGKSGGQNGFQLSLFGFTPQVDYASLTRDSRGRRVSPAAPEHSLLIRKATGVLPHGGGQRFAPGSPDHRLIGRWIRSGLPYGKPDDPTVAGISVYPLARALARGGRQQLAVTATYTDGRSEDVTARAQYSVAEPDYLEVDARGLVSALDVPGQGAVLVRYQGQVAVFRALIPSGGDPSRFPRPAARNYIDEHVFRKLEALGIPPSGLATDAEFLRRAAIDLCGTLPGAEEAAAFLADPDPGKRRKLVDRLLERPEHASYFALQWADLLRNRRGGEERAAPITIGFHGWLEESFRTNQPFDRFARAILAAEGSIADNPPVAWYRALENPHAIADDAAQVFLGTRIQCARCHHHPFEKWGQEDYWRFADFFARLDRKHEPVTTRFTVYARRGTSEITDDERTSASYRKTYRGLKLLGGADVAEDPDVDPRERLADWLVSPENPFFARAAANRFWKHFFGRGIVEPEDDLRDTNPPSNPELLEALARDFAAGGFDVRRLIRTITDSAAYQLSAVPNELNRADRQNFSRHQPSRLPAEVLLDALDQVTGRKTRFRGVRRDARAIDLPDEGSRGYFLEVFGKPERAAACSCERSGDITLPQVIHLRNSREMEERLRADDGRAARYARDPRPLAERIRELFLAAFSRPPSAEEAAAAEQHLARGDGKDGAPGSSRRAWEDLIWALVNTKEFLFKP
jgi:hypothetical protein